ncbi:MAG: phytanoyl-CoA dioxygenase [Paenibacillaceae bacterium]|nr:phytanoyl-CoA dioxygenase [Paenibacillaceae bacterium]
MKVKLASRELEMGGKYLTELRSSNDIADSPQALRERMDEDGYILIRGFHDRLKVLAARAQILDKMNQKGLLDSAFPIDQAVIRSGAKGLDLKGTNVDLPAYLDVVNSPSVMNFFDRYFGGPSLTYNYKWLRAVPTNAFTGAHYDIVYMGRGTQRVHTLWTPIGDIPVEMGTLAILLGSQHFERIKSTYGKMDVDRDRVEGHFSNDPVELVDKFGGQWATTSFHAGDAIFFGMHIMHASTVNTTNRYRISCDTRYQLATESVDERWAGDSPKGHGGRSEMPLLKMEEARKRWNVQ